MKPPAHLSFLTTLWIWVGLAQGAATVGLTQSASAGETNYFGPVALAPINATTNSPTLEDSRDAGRLLLILPGVARFYAANGEPSYADGPGSYDRVVRISQIGNWMNPGTWIVTFTERNGAVERTRMSGAVDTRRPEPYAMGATEVSKAVLDSDESNAYQRTLKSLRYAHRRPGAAFDAMDAGTTVLEIRDAQTHFISTAVGLTESEPDWWELRWLALATERTRKLRFQLDGQGGFTFDTGPLRGRLHADGKSLGLTEVYHTATGARLDRSNGLLSHYRVFANGRRFGDGAWDWPSTATRLYDGRAEVRWPATKDRPFAMRAVYRLSGFESVGVETIVEPHAELKGLEVFLASYLDARFTNALVCVKTGNSSTFTEATADKGEWQMYVRDDDARALVEDGRWQIEPHPVAWTFPAQLGGPGPMSFRTAPALGLKVSLISYKQECFAIATPHQTEGHFSTYLSLFGCDLPAGKTAIASAGWSVAKMEK